MKCLINIGKVCHNSRKVLSFCQFGRGGGRKKLILSQLHSCGLFIESLFSQLFSGFIHCHLLCLGSESCTVPAADIRLSANQGWGLVQPSYAFAKKEIRYRHSSSSFLTRLFYHYYFTIRAAMSLGGLGSAYGSSLASLSLNQSKNINKINNNESKNTDIQRLLEGLCFAAC